MSAWPSFAFCQRLLELGLVKTFPLRLIILILDAYTELERIKNAQNQIVSAKSFFIGASLKGYDYLVPGVLGVSSAASTI